MSHLSFISDANAVRDFGEWHALIDIIDPDDNPVQLRFSRRGTPTPASSVSVGWAEFPANQAYEKRILRAPVIRHSIWKPGSLGIGQSAPNWGELVLNNADGGLDQYMLSQGYRWAGGQITILFFDRRDMQGTVGIVFQGTVDDPKYSLYSVTIPLLGYEAWFDQNLSDRVYRGGKYQLELSGTRTVSYGTPAAVNLTGNMALSGWFWLETAPGSAVSMWGWGVAGAATPWTLNVNSNRTLSFRAHVGGGVEGPTTSTALVLKTPYHVSVSVSSRTVTFYIWNADTQTLTTETFTDVFSNATRDTNSGNTYRFASDSSMVIWGDEMQVWNTSRTLEQFEATRHDGLKDIPASCVHYTKMDDGSGTTVTDSSATGANGTISGAGTSTWLPTMEGEPDLAGTVKPDAWGRLFSIEPIMVEALGFDPAGVGTGPSYQVAGAGEIEEVTAVYEGGEPISIASDAASMRDFLVAVPAAGTCITYLARGLIKLGSQPTLPITCTIKGYVSTVNISLVVPTPLGYVETAAGIAHDIVGSRYPMLTTLGDPPTIDSGSLSDLDTDNSAPLGFYFTEKTKSSEALDLVLGSVGAWWGFKRGEIEFFVKRFEGPAVTPDWEFTERDIVSIELKSVDTRMYEVIINHRMGTKALSDGEVAESIKVDANWREFTKDHLIAKYTNSTLRSRYPGNASRSKDYNTGIYLAADAQDEAYRRQVLFGRIPEGYVVTVRSTGQIVKIDDTCSLSFTRAGTTRLNLDGTKMYSVLTTEDRMQEGVIMLEVWG